MFGFAVLYHWLLGHWIARFAMFSITFSLSWHTLYSLFSSPQDTGFDLVAMTAAIGIVSGWLFAGLPTYYHQGKTRRLAERTD